MKSLSKNKGFTLIELIVVCAIIGLLTAIVTANLTVSKAKANDAGRNTSIREVEKALELYYADHHSYPITLANPSDKYDCNYTSYLMGLNLSFQKDWVPEIAPEYISSLPHDPNEGRMQVCTGSPTFYTYKSCDGENYALTYVCAMETGVAPADKLYTPSPLNSIKVCRGDLGCANTGAYAIP